VSTYITLPNITMPEFTDDRDDVLGRLDLAQLFEDLGLHRGKNKQYPCPNPSHHQTGQTPPVSIGHDGGRDVWYCFPCEIGGSAVDLLTVARGVSVADAFDTLRQLVGLPKVTRTGPPPAPRPPVRLHPDDGRMTGDEADDVLGRYLESREWKPETADVFGLLPVRRAGTTWVRHPYRDGGTTVWWQDRRVGDGPGPKWWGPPGAERRLYARDLSTALGWAADGCLFVAEGPADVVALWHTAPGAAVVGIPGTAGLDRWRPLLAGLDLIVLTDPDGAGDAAALGLAEIAADTGGRSARARPPADVDDWRRQIGDDVLADAIVDLLEAVEWSTGDPEGGASWV
jgi:hypothetical protein